MEYQLLVSFLLLVVGIFQAYVALKQREAGIQEKEVLDKLQEVSQTQAEILRRTSEPPEFEIYWNKEDHLEIGVRNIGDGSATNFHITDLLIIGENDKVIDFDYVGDYQMETVEFSFQPGEKIGLEIEDLDKEEIKGIVIWINYSESEGHMILTYPPDLQESSFKEAGIPHPRNPKKYKILDDPFDLRDSN